MNPNENQTNPSSDSNSVGDYPKNDNHQYSKHALIDLQPDEELIFQVKQHKVILFAIYGGGILSILAFALIVFTVLPGIFPGNNGLSSAIGIIVFLAMTAFIFMFVVVLAFIYQRNGCILTNMNLAQVKRLTLFNSESIQLSLDKLQDITYEKKGFLAYVFGYGTIRCETAGEEPTFLFKYCPSPQKYSQQIIAAKEEYMKRFKEHNDGVNPPQTPINQQNVQQNQQATTPPPLQQSPPAPQQPSQQEPQSPTAPQTPITN